jgi:hypothetical protein
VRCRAGWGRTERAGRGSGCVLIALGGGRWLLDGEEDGAEQVPAAFLGRLVGQPGGDHLAQLGNQLLEFLAAEPDGVLPEADEISGRVGVFPVEVGGRDYQVTVDGDLARWQAALAKRPDVTIRIYDADDHMFFAGAGKSAPADYERPQHVDGAVVASIADWLAPGRGRGPIARIFSGRWRRHRLCGGRLR